MHIFRQKTNQQSSLSSKNNTSFSSVDSRKSSVTLLATTLSSSIANLFQPTVVKMTFAKLPSPPNPDYNPSGYLRSIQAVRERSSVVFEKGKRNELKAFDVDLSRLTDVVEYVVSIIKRDYGTNYNCIPPHGRWQHFEVGGCKRLNSLLQSWSTVDKKEQTRRLLDLFVVSVLLDAGAGAGWTYRENSSGKVYRRSEGLAIASLDMFLKGLFSSNPDNPHQVDGNALSKLTLNDMEQGFQVHPETNIMTGLEGRSQLLKNLGSSLLSYKNYFGTCGRPGNMLDYLVEHPTTSSNGESILVLIPTLWDLLMNALTPVWPQGRTTLDDGVPLGDAWPCQVMPTDKPHSQIVPFHKLTQWLSYSLMTPMSRLCNIVWVGEDLLTGLPEYRNGGLFVDTGLLTLKPEVHKQGIETYRINAKLVGQPDVEMVPMFSPGDNVIVEWRAMTIGLLDIVRMKVNKALGLEGDECLTLAQVLEAGTWKVRNLVDLCTDNQAGREVAEVSRPNTKGPPIGILSDGTVIQIVENFDHLQVF